MDCRLLVRNAELSGRRVDVRIKEGEIIAIEGALTPTAREAQIDARGGALLPGLHDHHLHLFSLAASLESIDCRPHKTPDAAALARVIDEAPPGRAWLRGAGYFESIAGPLDRNLLDQFCPDRPLRIQHRSGSMWFLNSHAIEWLGLDSKPTPEGVERDPKGRATGRLFRLDEWIREQLPASGPPDLTRVGRTLIRAGVTSVTDATPTNGVREATLFRDAQSSGAFPQRVHMLGSLDLGSIAATPELTIGAHKILLDEPALPDLDALIDSIRSSHAMERAVAIHTVTRGEILFALAAIDAAGARPGDRLEHASVAPLEAIDGVKRLALRIVTQPNFVSERGDTYLREVEARDRPHLYRLKTWIDSGVALGGGSDAPFGDADV